ncbi:hypothetical protein DY000_02000137 [Brassica cretica]|uniref:GDSL esterase/lipase n=1 Tax=Brassica cretica TaxID=69181 RepID=A0ABQ7CHZ8_BRACR|nr:hypothetical protein DY000_02000137 [Brassica cretica]
MNFAYGGTGVFNTQAPLPNMTTQIDFFQNILTAGDIYIPSNLISSVALVSVAGNDYSTFISQNRPASHGMNFAYGGTGVFNTQVPLPNMTTQIDFFKNILTAGDIYIPSNLISSVALVSVAGNDYSTFISQNRPASTKKRLQHGMNFAYGGTGVFNTQAPLPNMTTQIDFFQNILTAGDIYIPSNLISSVALVSVAGNDYSTFISQNRPASDFPAFIKQVVDQTEVNLRRIHALGVEKVAVPLLQPLGCLPGITFASSFQRCNETQNALVRLHNSLLQQAVIKLNNEIKKSTFIILDLYNAFLTVFNNKGANPGSTTFQSPLKPCCVGVSSEYNCGSVDEKGVKKYMICDDPKSAFFWDGSHPTEEGWRSVYSVLHQSLTASFMKA